MRMCVWLWSCCFVTRVTFARLLARTSSTADAMAQAMGFPPKVLKCRTLFARDLAISRRRRWRWVKGTPPHLWPPVTTFGERCKRHHIQLILHSESGGLDGIVTPPKSLCGILTRWLHLQVGPLGRSLRSNEGIRVGPNPTGLVSSEKETSELSRSLSDRTCEDRARRRPSAGAVSPETNSAGALIWEPRS